MKLLDALKWRYDVKQFSDGKVTAAELKALPNAACLIASFYNIIVVRSKVQCDYDEIVMEV